MNDSRETRLVRVSDDDFARLIAGAPLRDGVRVPPGGVEEPQTLGYLRALAARLEREWFRAAWAMLAENEIVGLIGCKAAPTAQGEVEIGYGVAAERRLRGHATAAVAQLVRLLEARTDVRAIVAETLAANATSQRVLERNGFARTGTRIDADDGELLRWHRSAREL